MLLYFQINLIKEWVFTIPTQSLKVPDLKELFTLSIFNVNTDVSYRESIFYKQNDAHTANALLKELMQVTQTEDLYTSDVRRVSPQQLIEEHHPSKEYFFDGKKFDDINVLSSVILSKRN